MDPVGLLLRVMLPEPVHVRVHEVLPVLLCVALTDPVPLWLLYSEAVWEASTDRLRVALIVELFVSVALWECLVVVGVWEGGLDGDRVFVPVLEGCTGGWEGDGSCCVTCRNVLPLVITSRWPSCGCSDRGGGGKGK